MSKPRYINHIIYTLYNMFSLFRSHLFIWASLVVGVAVLVQAQKLSAEDLPWGQSKEPTVITPQNINPVPGEQEERARPAERDNEPPRDNTYRREAYENPLPSYEPEPRQRRYEDRPREAYGRQDENWERRSSDRRFDREVYSNPETGEYVRRRSAPPPEYRDYDDRPPALRREYKDDTYSDSEILRAGHSLFGSVTKGLAKVIERVFSDIGRPNGYIVGEEAGGAFIAGLRYGEGTLHTKRFPLRKVYWQGPSIGYDFGAEGSKTMILVYRIQHPREIYQNFAGVNGSAYFIGGVGLTYQRKDDIVLARIQSGVGIRLGANVGYLKYTRRPTWNPF